MVAEQRIVGDVLPEVVELGGVAPELVLGAEVREEGEQALVADRHVDELPRHVPLDHQIVGRDLPECQRDLLPHAVVVGPVQPRPVVRLLEVPVDPAARRGEAHLEADTLVDDAVVAQTAEHPVRLERVGAVTEVVELHLGTRLDAEAPDAGDLLQGRALGAAVGLDECMPWRRDRLLERRMLAVDELGQHPDPVLALADLAVRQEPGVPGQRATRLRQRSLGVGVGHAPHEHHVTIHATGHRSSSSV